MKYCGASLLLLMLGAIATAFPPTALQWQPFVGQGAQLSAAFLEDETLRLEVINGYGGVELRFPPQPFRPITFRVQSRDFSALTVRLIDETGQYHQQDVALSGTGWTTVELRNHRGRNELHWGGGDDGAWHGRLIGIALLAQTGFLRNPNAADHFQGELILAIQQTAIIAGEGQK